MSWSRPTFHIIGISLLDKIIFPFPTGSYRVYQTDIEKQVEHKNAVFVYFKSLVLCY